MDIPKKDLQTIWNWLKKQITAEDDARLNERWPKIWRERSKVSPDVWEERWINTVSSISMRILDVLDIKAGRTHRISWVWRLVQSDLLELTEMLDLKLLQKATNQKILNLILAAIEKESN